MSFLFFCCCYYFKSVNATANSHSAFLVTGMIGDNRNIYAPESCHGES